MAKNYLLTYSEQLATNIELLCQNIKAPSNTLSTQIVLTKKHIKNTEIFAVVSDEC